MRRRRRRSGSGSAEVLPALPFLFSLLFFSSLPARPPRPPPLLCILWGVGRSRFGAAHVLFYSILSVYICVSVPLFSFYMCVFRNELCGAAALCCARESRERESTKMGPDGFACACSKVGF